MNETDALLRNVYSQANASAIKAVALDLYEEKIVKLILEKSNLVGETALLKSLAREKIGKAKLLFTWFYEIFPTFPVWLRSERFPFVHKTAVYDLWNQFNKTLFFDRWLELTDMNPYLDTKPTGLVFQWPRLRGGPMIIHDGHVNNDSLEPKFIHPIRSSKNVTMVTLERFEPYLDRLITSWAK